ncbi:MAG: 5'-methylthioadenosine/adenosylhomocysteine nucleosidase [Clostridia bacterium]|nr:5'-methylthioadenosine/adenosylhomocysteine nucleosidase [Clostridia bacterium]
MIGIICALREEAEHLKNEMSVRMIKTVAGAEYVSGKLFGKDAVIVVCGIGKVYAAVAAQTIVCEYSPDIIINTGVCGSLVPELKINDILVASGAVQHDMDTSPLGEPVGMVSGVNMIEFPCSKQLGNMFLDACGRNGFNAKTGIIATGDQFISDSAKKARLVESFGAVGCDMESGSIAHVCYINKLPCAIIRAISDNADEEAEISYAEFTCEAAKRSAKIVGEVINNI